MDDKRTNEHAGQTNERFVRKKEQMNEKAKQKAIEMKIVAGAARDIRLERRSARAA